MTAPPRDRYRYRRSKHQEAPGGCALLLALLAWLLPGASAIVQSIVDPAYDATAYFSDSSTLARYFIAVGTMLFTERRADARTLLMLSLIHI